MKFPLTIRIGDCSVKLRALRFGRVHSGYLPHTRGCKLLIPTPSPKSALLVELHKINVPCSTGYIRFALTSPALCGKLEQIPSPNRRFVYLSTSKNPEIELHGRPTFAVTYRLVDYCYDVLLTARNGSFEVEPTSKLTCSYKIHLPYGNKVALRLQMGTGPTMNRENDLANIIHEDAQAQCKGMELSLEDGESQWNHCSQPGDPLRSVQIVSERNSVRLNISVLGTKNTLAMWLKVWWMDKPIEEIIGHCDYGWVLSGDFCITAVRGTKKTWRQAEMECVRLGGHLASVLNERQQQTMDQLLLHAPGAGVDDVYWIGATDAVHEGEFRWSDSLPFTYAHWFPGWRKHSSQPNDDGTSGQDCVEVRREFPPRPTPSEPTFMWNDRGCHEHNYFVCERPSIEVLDLVNDSEFDFSSDDSEDDPTYERNRNRNYSRSPSDEFSENQNFFFSSLSLQIYQFLFLHPQFWGVGELLDHVSEVLCEDEVDEVEVNKVEAEDQLQAPET
ncbi:unnamed protein product [Parnassius apollo]|uniref:(apollo) hypothetical protein n=1 Tax=Parnassius apollo TaxID=110799 RepID=A0A8S3W8N8_PARAO|nr:unnamed protein product [Parnassius apollo]